MILIAQSIHRLPEAAVMEGAELIIFGDYLQRLLLEGRLVACDVFADLGREDKESTVDPLAVAGRLLLKIKDGVSIHYQRTEASGRLHGGESGEASVALV